MRQIGQPLHQPAGNAQGTAAGQGRIDPLKSGFNACFGGLDQHDGTRFKQGHGVADRSEPAVGQGNHLISRGYLPQQAMRPRDQLEPGPAPLGLMLKGGNLGRHAARQAEYPLTPQRQRQHQLFQRYGNPAHAQCAARSSASFKHGDKRDPQCGLRSVEVKEVSRRLPAHSVPHNPAPPFGAAARPSQRAYSARNRRMLRTAAGSPGAPCSAASARSISGLA